MTRYEFIEKMESYGFTLKPEGDYTALTKHTDIPGIDDLDSFISISEHVEDLVFELTLKGPTPAEMNKYLQVIRKYASTPIKDRRSGLLQDDR